MSQKDNDNEYDLVKICTALFIGIIVISILMTVFDPPKNNIDQIDDMPKIHDKRLKEETNGSTPYNIKELDTSTIPGNKLKGEIHSISDSFNYIPHNVTSVMFMNISNINDEETKSMFGSKDDYYKYYNDQMQTRTIVNTTNVVEYELHTTKSRIIPNPFEVTNYEGFWILRRTDSTNAANKWHTIGDIRVMTRKIYLMKFIDGHLNNDMKHPNIQAITQFQTNNPISQYIRYLEDGTLCYGELNKDSNGYAYRIACENPTDEYIKTINLLKDSSSYEYNIIENSSDYFVYDIKGNSIQNIMNETQRQVMVGLE